MKFKNERTKSRKQQKGEYIQNHLEIKKKIVTIEIRTVFMYIKVLVK